MPIYEFECCNRKHEILCRFEETVNIKCPQCGKKMKKLISVPRPITDTSFCMTGVVDDRLGLRPIEGRKDWNQRLDEKGYHEMTMHDLKEQED